MSLINFFLFSVICNRLFFQVQVIPWVLSDSNYAKQMSQRLDPQKTVFVGALHGMLTAEGLAHILNDLFGNVVYAGIDTDKHKYPIGNATNVWLCSYPELGSETKDGVYVMSKMPSFEQF